MKPVLPLTVPLLMVLLSAISCSAQDWTAKQALTLDSRTQVQLLPNGDLERVQEKTFEGWRPWQLGYEVDDQVKHGGRYSAKCTSASNDEQRGMTYVLTLNQQTPAPIMAELWSKADQVTGGQDSNYSLYLDLEYMDGTPLWGQTSPFKAATHDWQKRTVVVTPAKPIKSVSVHGIFRGRTGTAWFDDFRFWEVRVPGGVQQVAKERTPHAVHRRHGDGDLDDRGRHAGEHGGPVRLDDVGLQGHDGRRLAHAPVDAGDRQHDLVGRRKDLGQSDGAFLETDLRDTVKPLVSHRHPVAVEVRHARHSTPPPE